MPSEIERLLDRLRRDASGEAGRMSATEMYRLAELVDQKLQGYELMREQRDQLLDRLNLGVTR